MTIKKNWVYGMKSIVMRIKNRRGDYKRVYIHYAGKSVKGWKGFYENYGAPWRLWFNNPIFDNRSGYDDTLGRYRVWFVFMWHIVTI